MEATCQVTAGCLTKSCAVVTRMICHNQHVSTIVSRVPMNDPTVTEVHIMFTMLVVCLIMTVLMCTALAN